MDKMPINATDGELTTVKKKKRPWRQAVRNRARRDMKVAEGVDASKNEILPSPVGENGTKKKKKAKRKKVDALSIEMSGEGGKNDEPKKKKSKAIVESGDSAAEKMAGARFRYINEQLYTIPAKEAETVFAADSEAFDAYHRGYRSQLAKWPLDPLENICRELKTLPEGSIIADLGCGEAKMAARLGDRFKIYSFDLVAVNEHVTACNITKTPLSDESVDVAVYCLSLMGTSLCDFFREANRKLKIAEVMSRFRNVRSFIRGVELMGFQLKKKKQVTDFFLSLTFVKVGKVVHKRPTGLVLDSCRYKKR